MANAIEIGWRQVSEGKWSKDKYDRWRMSRFRAASQARVGDELWAKLFLVVGRVTQNLVDLVNANFEDKIRRNEGREPRHGDVPLSGWHSERPASTRVGEDVWMETSGRERPSRDLL